MLSPSGSDTSFVFLEDSSKPTAPASYPQPDPQVPDKVRVCLISDVSMSNPGLRIRSIPLCCLRIYLARLVHTDTTGLVLELEEK